MNMNEVGIDTVSGGRYRSLEPSLSLCRIVKRTIFNLVMITNSEFTDWQFILQSHVHVYQRCYHYQTFISTKWRSFFIYRIYQRWEAD